MGVRAEEWSGVVFSGLLGYFYESLSCHNSTHMNYLLAMEVADS